MDHRVFGGRFEMPHLANIARDHKGQERSACVNEHESEVEAGCEASKDLLKLHRCAQWSRP